MAPWLRVHFTASVSGGSQPPATPGESMPPTGSTSTWTHVHRQGNLLKGWIPWNPEDDWKDSTRTRRLMMYPVSAENSAERSIENWNGKVLCEVERLMQICYMVLLLLLQGSSIRKGVGFVCLLLPLLPQLYPQDLRQHLAYSRHLGIFVRWSNG